MIITILVYFSLVIILRSSGKRSLAKINAFDLVVTITIGAIASDTIISKSTTYLDGMLAIVILIILQYVIAKVSFFSNKLEKLVDSKPTLIFYDGNYLLENMKKMRISKSAILQQMRLQQGLTSNKVKAVVLETNGELSVIPISKDLDEEELKSYM